MATKAPQIGGPYLFLCPHCPKEFSEKDKARRHIATHDPKQYLCSACGKLFPSREELFKHSRTMHGGQWYKCNYCIRKFRTMQGLLRHMKKCTKAPTKDVTFACRHCAKIFSSRRAMEKHEKQHTASSVRCKQCGVLVPYLDFAAHEAAHVKLGNRCSSCGFNAQSQAALIKHIEVRHARATDLGLQCSSCDRQVGNVSQKRVPVY